ncbi:ATP-binding protein [uncultured Phenylobacterium sp.]|uniref:ATP-binding protein n=1 Tax=uncultured Phenylobacterium sp. TaxID=349273 RepID=UPI0025F6E55F|nr:ATP-binding protein [uncultured Phenylobacterium sp.]
MRRGLATALLFAGDAGIGDEATDKLAIVVEEWLINVVEHGEAAPGSRIALRFERLEGVVRLTVSDAGRAFDPRAFAFEGPNMERGGGAGLALIQAWSRVADYRRRAGRNRLVLEMPVVAPP